MKNTTPETCTLRFGSRTIPVSVYRRNRRTAGIAVDSGHHVYAYVPASLSEAEVQKILNKKARWIIRKLDEQQTYEPLPRPEHYVSGEILVYLGQQYRLKVLQGESGPVKLTGGCVYVPVPSGAENGRVKKAVEHWYRERAHELFPHKLTECLEAAYNKGGSEPRLSIRKMRRRWGSCSSAGRITLNLHLIQVPEHCVEYVIMHEISHLAEPNHSRDFYNLLTRCMPDWKERKQELDQYRL